jgi:phosphoglycerate kinase
VNKKIVTDIDVAGKRVLVRVDFNVPLSGKDVSAGISVTDDTRIRASLPTLNYLLEQGAALILCSHLGRPKSAADRHLAMDPVGVRLSEILGRDVLKLDEVVGETASRAAAGAHPGQVILLENTRFHPGEKKNDPELSRQLAGLADVYVDDAFGSAHRAHASTEGAARMMRAKGGPAVAGFLIEKELASMGPAVADPPHPYIAVIGGAKISDKVKLIEHLLRVADKVLIGGGMANTFLKADGREIGKSLVEEEAVPEAGRLLRLAGESIILPVDVVVAESLADSAECSNVPVAEIPADKMALDIGLVSVQRFGNALQGARLVIWNGPMGVFEIERYASGTNAMAMLLAALAGQGAQVIVGGGDSAAAVANAGLSDQMSHVSTGGGASLEFLEGRTLPGIAVLDDR